MQIKTLKEFTKAVEEKFGECYPLGPVIQGDWDGITFEAGRATYKYDYETEKIFKISNEISC